MGNIGSKNAPKGERDGSIAVFSGVNRKWRVCLKPKVHVCFGFDYRCNYVDEYSFCDDKGEIPATSYPDAHQNFMKRGCKTAQVPRLYTLPALHFQFARRCVDKNFFLSFTRIDEGLVLVIATRHWVYNTKISGRRLINVSHNIFITMQSE